MLLDAAAVHTRCTVTTSAATSTCKNIPCDTELSCFLSLQTVSLLKVLHIYISLGFPFSGSPFAVKIGAFALFLLVQIQETVCGTRLHDRLFVRKGFHTISKLKSSGLARSPLLLGGAAII